MNAIKSLCSAQTYLSPTEVKDCLELIKTSPGPQINKDGSNIRGVLLLIDCQFFSLDRRLRSSTVTRRETGLVDSLCNTTLFDFVSSPSDDSSSGNKRDRPSSGGSSKLTFSSKYPCRSFLSIDRYCPSRVEHFSQVLLNYFKQLHGEQRFSEMIFRMSLRGISKITIEEILYKDFNLFEQEIK